MPIHINDLTPDIEGINLQKPLFSSVSVSIQATKKANNLSDSPHNVGKA